MIKLYTISVKRHKLLNLRLLQIVIINKVLHKRVNLSQLLTKEWSPEVELPKGYNKPVNYKGIKL